MTQYHERYLIVDYRPLDGVMLRIDQWPEPLGVVLPGKGVAKVLSREEAEELVSRETINEWFGAARDERGLHGKKLHLDFSLTPAGVKHVLGP